MINRLIKNIVKGFILLSVNLLFAQSKFKVATIAFYNVENLFDTKESIDYIDGELHPKDLMFHRSISIEDELVTKTKPYKGIYADKIFTEKKIKILRTQILSKEFTPEGKKKWTPQRYQKKLENISRVISEIGKGFAKCPPVALGLAEVENRQVLEDLVAQPSLKPYHYGIIHKNSYDARGIDCAFIYRKNRLKIKNFETFEVKIYDSSGRREYTRDILFVEGLLDGEKIYFVVNHWPSRRKGQAASNYKREKAARVLKEEIIDPLLLKDPAAKIIILGDFNDDPTSPSIKKILKTSPTKKNLQLGKFYNPMEGIYKRGGGTSAYKDRWNCMDQIILSASLINKNKKQVKDYFQLHKVGIFKKKYLINPLGPFKKYPFRTYAGDTYLGGYSDHFPVYTILIKKN